MEKRINTKVETYIGEFKTNICERIKNIHFDKKEQVTELLQYVYDYDRICLTKDDFLTQLVVSIWMGNAHCFKENKFKTAYSYFIAMYYASLYL